jgi:hypothetical protein
MKQDKIFIWLAEERLKNDFLEWLVQNNESGASFSTLARAQDRQFTNELLTYRQQKLERLAKEYRAQREAKVAA